MHPSTTRALVLLPHNTESRWWPLTRGLQPLIEWPGHSPVLRQWGVGGWGMTETTQDMILFMFPPSLGLTVRTSPLARLHEGEYVMKPVFTPPSGEDREGDWVSQSVVLKVLDDYDPESGDTHICVGEMVKARWPRPSSRDAPFMSAAPFEWYKTRALDRGKPWWILPECCILLGKPGQNWVSHQTGGDKPKITIDLLTLNRAVSEYAASHGLTSFEGAATEEEAPAAGRSALHSGAFTAPPSIEQADRVPKRDRRGEDRRVRSEEATASERVERLRKCEEGCDHAALTSKTITVRCRGWPAGTCQRVVHSSCIGLSKSQAISCAYLCTSCTMASLSPAPDATPAQRSKLEQVARKRVLEGMICRLARNSQGFVTLENYIVSIEKEFAIGSPLKSVPSFKFFLSWLCDQGYNSSLDTHCRSAGTLMRIRGMPNLSTDKEVLVWIKYLKKVYGEHHDPDTPLPWVLFQICWQIIQSRLSAPGCCREILLREMIQIYLEFVGGLRIGEVSGSGQGHGLTFEDMVWGVEEDGSTFVEIVLQHSKTALFCEEVVMTGECEGSIDVIWAIEEYVKASGLRVITTECGSVEGTRIYEKRVEYKVCRVSLEGFTQPQMHTLTRSLKGSGDYEFATPQYKSWLEERINSRKDAEDDLLRFINITGGSEERCQLWATRLAALGFHSSVIAGPLARATRRINSIGSSTVYLLTHMPADATSAGKSVRDLINQSLLVYHAQVREGKRVRDTDVEKLVSPIWASHSFRRGGTKKAQSLMHRSGATAELIDMHFRWRSKELRRKMQNHYGGIKPRLWRLLVTKFF